MRVPFQTTPKLISGLSFAVLFLVLAPTARPAPEANVPAPPAAPAPEAAEVHGKALKSSLWVVVERPGNKFMLGTGWVVDADRLLAITSAHVTGDDERATVYLPATVEGKLVTASAPYLRSKRGIRARVIALDRKRDLALLRLDRLPPGTPALQLAKAEPNPGQPLFMIGNSSPATRIDQRTLWRRYQGTVATVRFRVFTDEKAGVRTEARQVEYSPPSSPGDSGGPILDADGKVVGITEGSAGVGFAVSAAEIATFLRRAGRREPTPSADNPVAGTWTVAFPGKDGGKVFMGMTFEASDRCAWDLGPVHPGTYSYTEGRLKMTVPGANVDEEVAVTWDGPDRFSFESAGMLFSATRR